jgi:ribosomal protein S4E
MKPKDCSENKEEQDMKLLKIRKKLDIETNKRQYYEDLGKQKILKIVKEKNNTLLSQNEAEINKASLPMEKSSS